MHMPQSKDNQNVQRSLRSGTRKLRILRLNGGSGGSATHRLGGNLPVVCVKTVPPDSPVLHTINLHSKDTFSYPELDLAPADCHQPRIPSAIANTTDGKNTAIRTLNVVGKGARRVLKYLIAIEIATDGSSILSNNPIWSDMK
jgi:hypothetical protein